MQMKWSLFCRFCFTVFSLFRFVHLIWQTNTFTCVSFAVFNKSETSSFFFNQILSVHAVETKVKTLQREMMGKKKLRKKWSSQDAATNWVTK